MNDLSPPLGTPPSLRPRPDPATDRPGPRAIWALLRREIVTLRLRPGERLSENELAERFGTSRAPAREALIRLAEDGLIEVRPQRGSFVSRISLAAMHRARFVREALEVAIVRRAAELGVSDRAARRFDEMIAEQMAAADDPEAFTRLDDLFHRTVADVAGEAAVWAIIEREKVQFDRVRFLSLPAVTPVSVLIAQHRAVVAAITRRDVAAAEAAMRVHMTEVLKITGDLADRFPDLIVVDDRDPQT
jgi:DNA-binding GntR family transcriptional regulator